LRVATAVLSLVSFALMVSARTSGWAGDHYGRYEQYRYAVGVNIVVCIYSIAQAFGESRRLVSPRFHFRSTSSYYFSLFLDQVLA
ncbi:MARVEL-like domain-containing protein, partial [Shewanella sp. A3A]|nr:MARVEL-like domain-containing protein [Shewanella ferrihydritica]